LFIFQDFFFKFLIFDLNIFDYLKSIHPCIFLNIRFQIIAYLTNAIQVKYKIHQIFLLHH